VPLTVDTLALYYNKASYDDSVPARGKPAATWEELKDDVFKLTKKDNSFERFEVAGMAMGRSDNIARAVDILYLLMLQYGTKFYNDNISSASFAAQTSSTATGVSLNPATEALTLYTGFSLPANKNYSWNSYLADSNSAVKEMETFSKGKVAMIFGYSYLYDQILSDIKELQLKGINTIDIKNIRIAEVPQVIDSKTSTEKRVAYANYYAETVSRTSQNPQEAWDFINYISSKQNLAFYNEKTHRPTSRRDMIDDQVKDPIYGVFAQQIGYAESLPIYDDGRYFEIFSKAIDSVLKTVSATDAIRTAESEINIMLPEGGLIPPAPKENTTVAQPASAKTGSSGSALKTSSGTTTTKTN
jgi:ABC-type glycerol-3-phosphate transport system substrate-binding protein